jgi:hypothetical protein
MLKVKSIGKPTPGAHWSYGVDHMTEISKANAAKLCGMHPLPKMGYEMVCAFKKHEFGGFDRLMVQNISGMYFLACTSVQSWQWAETFGIEVSA